MDNPKLPPIPTPISQRWREFRIQVLPFAVFVLVLAGIVHLWRNFVQPVGIVGFVETNQVHITPLQDGLVGALFIERFQSVTQGQEIAVVITSDPKLIQAQVSAAQADLAVMRDRLVVDKVRTDQNFQSFREKLFTVQFEQVEDRAGWPLASNAFRRADALFKNNNLPEADYDAASNALHVLTERIKGRDLLISNLTVSIDELRPKVFPPHQTKDSIDLAMDAKAAELEAMLKPSTLRSPINGIVSMVNVQQGEQVRRGIPIADITPHSSDNIIGYIRQPIQRHPKLGDKVQVTTRTSPRKTAWSTVRKIGAQLEAINPGLLSPETPRMEMGLPIVVDMPDSFKSSNFKLLPGEFVDIAFRTKE